MHGVRAEREEKKIKIIRIEVIKKTSEVRKLKRKDLKKS